MLQELSVSPSGFDFTNSNYNYDNANVSFYLCYNRSINLAIMAKNNMIIHARARHADKISHMTPAESLEMSRIMDNMLAKQS